MPDKQPGRVFGSRCGQRHRPGVWTGVHRESRRHMAWLGGGPLAMGAGAQVTNR